MAFDFNESGNFGGAVSTTDATPTRIFEADLSNFDGLGASDVGVAPFRLTVIAGVASGNTYARMSRFAVSRASGTTSLLIAEVVESESTSAWTVTVGISGAKLVIDVTGEAATNISWRAFGQFAYGGFVHVP